MTNTKQDGGPAFPRPSTDYGRGQAGMTLRDWFAGQALAGMLTHEAAADADKDKVAEQAYYYADFMLEARK